MKYQIVIYLLGEWVHFHRRPMIEAMGRNAQGVANILCVNPIWCARQVTARSPEPRLDRRTRIGLEKIYENLYVLTPLLHWPLFFRLLATYFHPIVRYLIGPQVQAALREIDASSKNRVTWIYHPWQIDCLGLIGERCVVYECYDEIRLGAFTDKPQPSIEKLERKLLRRADLVFVTAESLYESRSQLHHNVHYISNGTDFQLFSQIYDADLPVASDLLSIPLPRIGFVGNISNVLDFPLLEHVAVTNSTWSIVLIGPVHESAIDEVTALRRLSNVYFLGMKRYSELPCYLKGFDVAIIPFKINEFIYNSNPLKLWEYLASGKLTVTIPIKETEKLRDIVFIARDRSEFVSLLHFALHGEHPDRIERGIEIAREHSWDILTKKMLDVLCRTMVSTSGKAGS